MHATHSGSILFVKYFSHILLLFSFQSIFCSLSVAANQTYQAPSQSDQSYKMGIVPFITPVRLEEIFAPAAAEMGKTLNKSVEFRTTQSFDKYFESLKNGEYDIALVHAFFYVSAVDEFKYKPLARMTEPFTAVLVVQENSPLKSLEDLKGKVIATPPEFLPTVHLVRKVMKQKGYKPSVDFKMKSFKAVDSCLQQVVIGEAAACIAPPFALRSYEEKMKVNFRILVESPSIPSLTFIVHSRVPQAERTKLRELITGWSNSETGKQLIQPMQTRAFVPAQDAEFDQVRALIKSLDEPWLPSSL